MDILISACKIKKCSKFVEVLWWVLWVTASEFYISARHGEEAQPILAVKTYKSHNLVWRYLLSRQTETTPVKCRSDFCVVLSRVHWKVAIEVAPSTQNMPYDYVVSIWGGLWEAKIWINAAHIKSAALTVPDCNWKKRKGAQTKWLVFVNFLSTFCCQCRNGCNCCVNYRG